MKFENGKRNADTLYMRYYNDIFNMRDTNIHILQCDV